MENIQQLISGYLDDELTADEAGNLAVAVESDSDALDRLVLVSFVHSQLLDWMGQSQIADGAAFGAARVAGVSARTTTWLGGVSDLVESDSYLDDAAWPIAGPTAKRSRLWSLSVLAAMLLVAVGLSIIVYVSTSGPSVVAQLTSATNSQWGKSRGPIPVGSLLHDQQELALEKGSALITFVSGTQLLLEAPVSIRLTGRNEIHLGVGRIAAKVPTQAHGFAVSSSLARFVDLGTAFTLTLDAVKSFQLHVFEGLVELQLDERFGEAAHQPLRVAEVRTVTFDVTTGKITAPPFEEGKQMPF
jgi:hypothetical protein